MGIEFKHAPPTFLGHARNHIEATFAVGKKNNTRTFTRVNRCRLASNIAMGDDDLIAAMKRFYQDSRPDRFFRIFCMLNDTDLTSNIGGSKG